VTSTRSVVSPVRLASRAQSSVLRPRFSASRVHLEQVLLVPQHVVGAAGLRADVVLAEDAPGGQQQRIARAGLLVGRHVFGDHELALAAGEALDVHDRRALREACR
jgi:hypothetical protein